MNALLLAAACLAGVTLLVHTLVGHRFVVVPLLANRSLTPASRWLNYYCWHLTTLLIAFIAVSFVWLASAPLSDDRWVVLLALCTLATLCALWSMAVAIIGRINPFRFPSTSLFLATSALGWAAVVVGR